MKFKQIIEEKDLVGKTILRVNNELDNIFAIFFDNNEFAIINGCGWDENEVELSGDIINLKATASNAYVLKELGFIDQSQHDVLRAEMIFERKRIAKEKELAEYERLKAKFEKD